MKAWLAVLDCLIAQEAKSITQSDECSEVMKSL